MSNQITMFETFADTLRMIGKAAAQTYAPELTNTFTRVAGSIKKSLRVFNQPKEAVYDLFKENPDTFRNCKIKELIKNSAAGVTTSPVLSSDYLNSYKAVFSGSVKSGQEANAPLVQSDNFSITVKPTNNRNDLKYVADDNVYKDDKEFTKINRSSDPINYMKLFNTAPCKTKFTLNPKPNFNRLGDIKKGYPEKGFRLNFDGKVKFSSRTHDVRDDEYIIVINKRNVLTSDGELYKGIGSAKTVINSSTIINYSQKNILFEVKKLVDLNYIKNN